MRIPGLGLVIVIACAGQAAAREPDPGHDLPEAVATILETHCVRCHNDDTAKGKLSLTRLAAALQGGNEGPAIVPNQPDQSLLLEKISGERPEMPRGSKPLGRAQIETIRGWIAAGAPWPKQRVLHDRRFASETWWAFQPLRKPSVPTVQGRDWLRNPIDAFILARLESQRLQPSAEADRRILIRRACFDLLGLPPTPEEVDSFVNDPAPDAYERLLDRLLSSPHYGERWGRHWLDIAHYGDTHGYDKDKRRDHAWPYRDYVVSGWNADLPYDQFIREQLAGDVLWPGSRRGTVATGFIVAGPWDFVGQVELREGTIDKLKTRVLDRDDMVTTAMGTFVSLTVHCARCHDHKFDPIPQRDYYQLQAVFSGIERGDRRVPSAAIEARRGDLEARRSQARARLARIDEAIATLTSSTPLLAQIDRELKELRGHHAADGGGPITSPSNGYHSAIYPDANHTLWIQLDLGSSRAIDEIVLVPARPTDFPDTPGFGFPPAYRVELSADPVFEHAAVVSSATDAEPGPGSDEPRVIRAGGRHARYVRITATRLWKRLEDYVFALAEIEILSGGVNLARGAKVSARDSIDAGRWRRDYAVDGFDSRHRLADPADAAERARFERIMRGDELAAERQRKILEMIGPARIKERVSAQAELEHAEAALAALPRGEPVYAAVPVSPRTIHLLRRGDVEQPGPMVAPGSLSCLKPLNSDFSATRGDEGRARAALAEWIANRENVLTWRSIANRVWHYHFGRGIVDTPSDFGRNGGAPTHPELLDYLACQVRDDPSLKRLHRLIMSSAVYRQTSAGDPARAAIDADNRFLWRQNRRRLDAESVRDGVLFSAQALDTRMGGPGFELFAFKDDHSPVYDHTDPTKIDYPQARRRSIYRFVVRSVANPFMEALDCPDPSINTPVRSQTLTALQALALWNDLFMVRLSQEFARSLEQQPGTVEARVTQAYRRALGRSPTEIERKALATYASQRGLANVCRLIWNMSEFNFID